MIELKKLQESYNQWYLQKREASKKDKLRHTRFCKKILQLLEVKSAGRLLDVGCGDGSFLKVAEEEGLKTYGIDISTVTIAAARKIAAGSWIQVSAAENLPYKNNYFDYVTCLGSLEHFPNPEKGIKEISRVLKEDGRAFIHVPNLFFLGHIYMALRYGIKPSEGGQQFSERFSTRHGWQTLLERNGLKVIRFYKYNDIWATKKVSKIAIFFWNLLKPFIPTALSYSFDFVCKKGGK